MSTREEQYQELVATFQAMDEAYRKVRTIIAEDQYGRASNHPLGDDYYRAGVALGELASESCSGAKEVQVLFARYEALRIATAK